MALMLPELRQQAQLPGQLRPVLPAWLAGLLALQPQVAPACSLPAALFFRERFQQYSFGLLSHAAFRAPFLPQPYALLSHALLRAALCLPLHGFLQALFFRAPFQPRFFARVLVFVFRSSISPYAAAEGAGAAEGSSLGACALRFGSSTGTETSIAL